jgi:hypothetical protein
MYFSRVSFFTHFPVILKCVKCASFKKIVRAEFFYSKKRAFRGIKKNYRTIFLNVIT